MGINRARVTPRCKTSSGKLVPGIRTTAGRIVTLTKTLGIMALLSVEMSADAQVDHQAGTSNKKHVHLNKHTMSNQEILSTANEAITKGDYEGYLSYCAENTDWTFEGEQRLIGKEAVRQYMKRTYLTPPVFTTDKMIASEDYVVAMGTIVLPDAQGRSVRYSYCDVWRFKDGKLAGLNAYVVPEEMK
jgi:ketosteroid isomerase-like protein